MGSHSTGWVKDDGELWFELQSFNVIEIPQVLVERFQCFLLFSAYLPDVILKGQKKKKNIVMLPKMEFLKCWISWSFLKHPEVHNLGAFCTISSNKKTPNLNKIGCFRKHTFYGNF